MHEVLLLLLGAVVGGVVGFGVERIKTRFDRRTFKHQLLGELTTNLHMLPFMRKHLTESLRTAQIGGSPNMRAVHFCTACYDAHFSTVLPILSPAEQVSLQMIYENLRICNEITDTYSRIVFAVSTKEEHERLLRIYAGTLQSAIGMTEKTEQYIRDHMNGQPTDFFSALP
jgi:hypothetical protein